MGKITEKPDNNMAWAIVCSVLCSIPLGVIAIFRALSVDRLWDQKQYEKAYKAASDVEKIALAGALLSFIGYICFLISLACGLIEIPVN